MLLVDLEAVGRDASDWDEPGQSVRARFRAAGYRAQELWALSYNGGGGNPLTACRTDNARNVPGLAAFLQAVLAYTGAPRVDVVAHSLGVTLTRATLRAHPALAGRVRAFVAIAGPNHGTPLCVSLSGWQVSCGELAPGSPFLRELNGPEGAGVLLLPRIGHDALRVTEAAVAGYLAFLQGRGGGERGP